MQLGVSTSTISPSSHDKNRNFGFQVKGQFLGFSEIRVTSLAKHFVALTMSGTLDEFADRIESSCSTSGWLKLSEYQPFWENLIAQPKNASHFVTILISKFVHYMSGQYKSCAFKEFLSRMSGTGLLSGDLRVVPFESQEINILFFFIYHHFHHITNWNYMIP
jgi:hypothetical protein